MSLKTSCLVALFLLVIGTQTLKAQNTIPESPAGRRLSAFIDSINSSDADSTIAFLKDAYSVSDEATLAKRKSKSNLIRSQLGTVTVEKISSSSENQIVATCKSSSGLRVAITLTVEEQKPFKIKSVGMEMAGAEDATNDSALDDKGKTEIIETLSKELRAKYVFPEVAEKMATAIEQSLKAGEYTSIVDAHQFATHLTNQLRSICNDKHLRVRAGAPNSRGPLQSNPSSNHGFVKVEMLPGGIGYLKFNFFSGEKEAQETAAAAMNFLGHSNALIFDLRENGGGSPEMIAFLSSYLFEDPTHLNSFYNRPNETTTETWTQKKVPGKKFSAETPIYVLTSTNTFSGAEEFSYNLKNLKRGTIVGETTGGGAHPVMPVQLGKQMYMTMPFARAINPITNSNWEGVGVQPDVEVSADQALEKAISLAQNHAADLAAAKSTAMETTNKKTVDLNRMIEEASRLMANESFADAAVAFAKITEIDANNGEAWFRYSYCLHMSGNIDKALEAHQKAAGFDEFSGIANYNIACVYSLKNNIDESFDHLEKAIKLGFGNASQMNGDSDLKNIRKDPRYAKLIEKLKSDN